MARDVCYRWQGLLAVLVFAGRRIRDPHYWRLSFFTGCRKLKNPGYSWTLAVDEEVIDALRHESTGLRDTVDMLLERGAPKVMLADIWRYAVLYKHGGVYADVDTVSRKPVDSWLPPATPAPQLAGDDRASAAYSGLSMDQCAIIIAMENDVHFCQWTLASIPGHPILGRVLELIVERAKDFPHDVPDFVHYHSGPAVFTAGILDVLGLDRGMSAAAAFKKIWTDDVTRARAWHLKACFLSDDFFSGEAITHHFSSQWAGKDAENRQYSSWTEEAKRFSHEVTQRSMT